MSYPNGDEPRVRFVWDEELQIGYYEPADPTTFDAAWRELQNTLLSIAYDFAFALLQFFETVGDAVFGIDDELRD